MAANIYVLKGGQMTIIVLPVFSFINVFMDLEEHLKWSWTLVDAKPLLLFLVILY